MTVEISSKIIGIKVKKESKEQVDEVMAPVVADIDPLLERIANRPDGTLEAVSEKITYFNYEGKKNVYVLVSFLPVEGVLEGNPITIERPIEFFFPIGQSSSEHQWITATMRNLSLAARGSYVTQALADLRKVSWDKGPVRCGWNQWGKPIYHDSEVAAIAWSIQQILHKRGFLDIDGNQVPTPYLARAYASRQFGTLRLESEVEPGVDSPDAPSSVDTSNLGKSVGQCPTCQSDLYLMDGCPTCVTGCGYSKCG
jgi:ribonucleoside-diphosphate reductase alpha chain